jgi:hypothetical protein
VETGNWGVKKALSEDNPDWIDYEGKWGADSVSLGEDGPQGPKFLSPLFSGGIVRFLDPVEWAGIDKVGSQSVSSSTNFLEFVQQLASFLFTEALEVGTEMTVDLHEEVISFGGKPEGTTLLSRFWDFTSSLVNDTFEVEVTLQYNPDEVVALEGDESNLRAFLYSETENLWEQVESIVNTEEDTISFTTTHFSRYAIGLVESEPEEDDEDKGRGCKSGRNGKSHTIKICNSGHATVINNIKGGAHTGGNSANGEGGQRENGEEESSGPWGALIRSGDPRTNIDVANLLNQNRLRFRHLER